VSGNVTLKVTGLRDGSRVVDTSTAIEIGDITVARLVDAVSQAVAG
jgi:hypothetical protein